MLYRFYLLIEPNNIVLRRGTQADIYDLQGGLFHSNPEGHTAYTVLKQIQT